MDDFDKSNKDLVLSLWIDRQGQYWTINYNGHVSQVIDINVFLDNCFEKFPEAGAFNKYRCVWCKKVDDRRRLLYNTKSQTFYHYACETERLKHL